jgi:ABC-type methionine transport system ATPase subunit
MPEKSLRLIYPPSLLREPVLNRFIRTFDLVVNILQANITMEEGWLDIQVTGEENEIKRAIQWLEAEGLTIEELD